MPISKRDKKRNQHIQLQQDIVEDFTLNRDPYYKAQLIALQYDMSLITQADPYNPEPMEDSPDEIARAVEEAAAGTPYQAEMSKMAGRWYSEFVHEVNEAKEAKEIELTQLVVSNCQSLPWAIFGACTGDENHIATVRLLTWLAERPSS